MPTYDTPGPITATVELVVGDLRVAAADRTDTVVEVRPSDPAAEADVRAADQTRVEYADGRLLVKTPKQRGLGLLGKPGSVDVTLDLPAGSQFQAEVGAGGVRAVGALADTRVKCGVGDVQLDRVGPLTLETGAGRVDVDSVAGRADISTGSGRLRVREVDGPAVVKNSNGDSWLGLVSGDLRINAANGDITVDRAGDGAVASTANGGITIGAVTRGTVSLKTGFGEIEVGIPAGTAAKLDVSTSFGRIRNQLDSTEGPQETDETIDLRARSSYGDIVIRRSAGSTA
ncbi:MAG TPA: DUF4097 family beta strand repeat-containing protein [Mycobacteriales bacterium]